MDSFESREICEQIIHDFNNYPVTKQGEDEEHLIQIRYSDTQEQKMLKQQTAAARTYRADEFEAGVMYARGRLMAGSLSAYPQYAHANGDDFEQYLTQNTGCVKTTSYFYLLYLSPIHHFSCLSRLPPYSSSLMFFLSFLNLFRTTCLLLY